MVLKGLLYLFGLLTLGDVLSGVLGLPIPGSLVGMLLLTVLLYLKVIKEKDIKVAAETFTENMAILFVPPGVSLIMYFDVLEGQWIPILGACFISTILVLSGVGLFQQKMDKIWNK